MSLGFEWVCFTSRWAGQGCNTCLKGSTNKPHIHIDFLSGGIFQTVLKKMDAKQGAEISNRDWSYGLIRKLGF